MTGVVILLAVGLVVCLLLLWIRTANMRALLEALSEDRAPRLSAPDGLSARLAVAVSQLQQRQRALTVEYQRQQDQLRTHVACLSHDFRTPLTAIAGYLQLIRSGQLSPEENTQALDTVCQRTRLLRQLADDFYDLSRLEAGYALQLEPVQLHDLLAELLADSYQQISQQQIEPVVSLAEELPAVQADRGAARRILQNLLQNALRYGTGLEISTRRCGRRAEVRFVNEAPGLTSEMMPHLFDRFYTGTPGGSGLGLTVVAQFCQRMQVEVRSRLTDGRLEILLLWPLASEN